METLDRLRHRIDVIDTDIIDLLAERFKIAKVIGDYKFAHHLPIVDNSRWETLIASHTAKAVAKGISPQLIMDIRNRIHQESIVVQQQKKSA